MSAFFHHPVFLALPPFAIPQFPAAFALSFSLCPPYNRTQILQLQFEPAYHNVVFVGLDRYHKPRYANLRGIGTDFIGEANGSDKRFSFSIPAQNSDALHLFESAIDLLSFATLVKQNGGNWQRDHLVSLAGVYKPKENLQESSLPLTLTRYLSEYPNIKWITLRLDNDKAGGYMAKALVALLSDKYEVSVQPPPCGKDYNDYLCMKLGIPITHRKSKAQER